MDIFLFFQNGVRRKSWITSQKWRHGTLRIVRVYQFAKFGDNNSDGGRVIAIFRFSKWRPPPSWILLDFIFRFYFQIRFILSKILRFQFSKIWLKMPIRAQNCFFGISPHKHFGLSSRPQKALPCAEPRILTYSSSKSVNRGDLQARWRNEKNKRKSQTVTFHAFAQTTHVGRLLPYKVRSPT